MGCPARYQFLWLLSLLLFQSKPDTRPLLCFTSPPTPFFFLFPFPFGAKQFYQGLFSGVNLISCFFFVRSLSNPSIFPSGYADSSPILMFYVAAADSSNCEFIISLGFCSISLLLYISNIVYQCAAFSLCSCLLSNLKPWWILSVVFLLDS